MICTLTLVVWATTTLVRASFPTPLIAPKGCCVHPQMTSMWHPIMYVKYKVFLTSAGVSLDSKNMDKDYVERLVNLIKGIRPYGAAMLSRCRSPNVVVSHGAITSSSQWIVGTTPTESTPRWTG